MSTRSCLVICCALWLAACGDEPRPDTCTNNNDCPPGERCDDQGSCYLPTGAEDGKACSASADCKSGVCHDDESGSGGVCVTACKASADCQAGQVCVPRAGRRVEAGTTSLELLCQAPGSGQGFMAEACTKDDDCKSGLCHQSRCTEPCATCPGELLCSPASVTRGKHTLQTSLCERKLIRIQELGSVTTTASAGGTPVSFTIAAGTTSFLLFADDTDDLRVVITRLESPSGKVLVDFASPASGLMMSYDYFGTGSVQVPGTDDPAGKVVAGKYKAHVQTLERRFDLDTPVKGKVERVAVISRRSSQKGGLLDLDLYFSPKTGITAAQAPSNAFVKGTLTQLAKLLDLTGIGLGRVRYANLTAAEDIMKTAEDVRTLRKNKSRPGPNGLSASVFVVDTIKLGYTALAGGIPGVPGLVGTSGSGIVTIKESSTTKMGKLLAHELGHYLGLWHTTETQSSGVDFIKDTPVCPTGTSIKKCPDFTNLMFPYYQLAPSPLKLTAGQAMVLRGSPFLYEEVFPGACGAGSEVVNISSSRYASGTTAAAGSVLSASCGGAGQPERIHLYRAASGLTSLEITAYSADFAPVVYVFKGSCDSAAAALQCTAGAKAKAAKVTLSSPAAGAYFVVVDGAAGSGNYTLKVVSK